MITVELDRTTLLFLAELHKAYAAEPEEVDTDKHDGHWLVEVSRVHEEWERHVQAIRLLVAIRTANLAIEATRSAPPP